MFGLLDCNNFYVSCERVFNPSLNNRPVVVLSNNDGYIISRSNEAKALGIKMATPPCQIKELIEKHNIAVFSSNYQLYGDMSNRVMSIISQLVPGIEVYSIDEAFISLAGLPDVRQTGEEIVKQVCKGTGIPVSLGIAPTKTLAKTANKFAKKYPAYNRLCIIDSDEKRDKALKLTEIDDIWGIGRRHAERLRNFGVHTAYDFTQLSRYWVKKHMTVQGLRTWLELQGESCIDMELMPPPKKQVCISRTFGFAVSDFTPLAEAIANHAARCAEKLRQQKLAGCALMVFIDTDHFQASQYQYFQNIIVPLPVATNHTGDIVHHACRALEKIYRKDFAYKKAGVIVTEVVPECAIQQNLFESTVDYEKNHRLMQVMDQLNHKFPHNKIKLASQGVKRSGWVLKQEHLSKCYTTKIGDIIEVKCD